MEQLATGTKGRGREGSVCRATVITAEMRGSCYLEPPLRVLTGLGALIPSFPLLTNGLHGNTELLKFNSY